MSNRSWFFASEDKQQGPYPEDQFRDFIARGLVRADTLVWSEGMAGWQRAGDTPGLLSGGSAPPVLQQFGGPVTSAAGGGVLSIEFGIWEFIWRSLVLAIGCLFIIPVPWVVTMYCRWIVSRVRVPQRPNLSFTGRPVQLMWFYVAIVLIVAAAWARFGLLHLATYAAQVVLYWLLIRWFVANISSDGQSLALRFSGSFWGYLGWIVLVGLSVITIIGWAWVYVAQIRWMCRHIEGTRHDVVFEGSGLEFLWRSIVTLLVSLLIIPSPWMYRWFTRWLVSQVALVERGSLTNG
jgi:GYF domain 2